MIRRAAVPAAPQGLEHRKPWRVGAVVTGITCAGWACERHEERRRATARLENRVLHVVEGPRQSGRRPGCRSSADGQVIGLARSTGRSRSCRGRSAVRATSDRTRQRTCSPTRRPKSARPSMSSNEEWKQQTSAQESQVAG